MSAGGLSSDDSTTKELLGSVGLQIWNKALHSASLSSGNAIPLDQFVEAYLSYVKIPLHPIDKPCLATIFADHGENREDYPLVTKRQLALFLLRFGPPERTLSKIRDVLQNGKVYVSERLLNESPRDRLFLLRYSSVPGAFTVDYVKDGRLCHFNNIRNDPKGGVQVIVGKPPKQQIYKYSSLSAFIAKNKHLFSYPCTNPRSHFQWMKVQIPSASSIDEMKKDKSRKPEAKKPTHISEDKEDARKQRVKNAIAEAYRLNEGTLELRGYQLGPATPSQIVLLKYLTSLDLSRNSIEEIPTQLANLYKLKSLNLSYNKLKELPGDIFLSLGKLNSFVCSDNSLTSLPPELFSARKLSYLDFSGNQLIELSTKISSLRMLQFLDLSTNNIASLPVCLAELTKLEELYVKGNKLRSIPASLASAPSLMVLDASHNQITAMPEEFYALLRSNPKFVSITTGNPVDAEITKRKEAEAKRDTSSMIRKQRELHQSVDIFQLLGIPPDERGTFKIPENIFPSPLPIPAEELRVSHSLWAPSPGYRSEEGYGSQPSKASSLTFQERNMLDDYVNYFYKKTVHANIIGTEKQQGHVCISIQKELADHSAEQDLAMAGRGALAIAGGLDESTLSYRVLLRTKQGDQRLFIPANMLKKRKKESLARSEDLLAALRKLMKPIPFSHKHLWVIRDVKSHDTFADLETKLQSNAYKFGVIYGTDGQGETEMYKNIDGSAGFKEFMRLLGDEVCLRDWPHYRGGLSAKSDWKSIYTKFHSKEVMFHVSTMLPFMEKTDKFGQQWERKRYIGNDIVVLLYYEGTTPVDPNIFKSNFNHVFCMVQPEMKDGKKYYRTHFTFKEGVAESQPRLPEDNLFEKGPLFREWILTKLINAERCAMEAAQFRKAQERVRSELFADLQTVFPKKKERVAQVRRAAIGYMSREEASSLQEQLHAKGDM